MSAVGERAVKIWTEAELQSMPDEGYSHEVVNGQLGVVRVVGFSLPGLTFQGRPDRRQAGGPPLRLSTALAPPSIPPSLRPRNSCKPTRVRLESWSASDPAQPKNWSVLLEGQVDR